MTSAAEAASEGARRTRELPTGPVTFLFSDIEGSTRLLQSLGERYPDLLETHHRLLREAISANRGLVVNTEGDAFFAVFTAAEDAIAAAARAQRDLDAQAWPDDRSVRVRMGIHAGTGMLAGSDYAGLDVHRAARIMGAAHGGQVLLSQATIERAAGRLPAGARVRELGPHRLKDIVEPERLHQLVIDGLPDAFPALAGAAVRRGNLPAQLGAFVGRRRLLDEVEDVVLRSRLVTLTGPGGTGKTTLALRCGRDLLPRMTDGVYFTPLAAITDPALVLQAVMQTLAIEDDPSRRPTDLLADHLAQQDVLLILDNLEQVLGVAPEVREVLERTERPRILATSREPLGVRGELQVAVPPMETPNVGDEPDVDQLLRVEAVELFVERAAAVRPGFTLDAENARAVAEICARLDGLPLAIELAAARVRILSPQQILERLARRLPLLARDARDVPTRQRTLRDTIAWSHDLLDEGQRVIYRRLSVFEGGFNLAAAEAIDLESRGDTFEGLAALVNKSLVRSLEGERHEPRFLLLETIREFAGEQLEAAGERETIERRHVEHFLALAEAAVPELTGGRAAHFLDRLTADHDNLRRALERASARGWTAEALRLGTALWRFWQMRGHLREARERLSALVALPGAAAYPREHARAVSALGSVAYWMADFSAADAHYRAALEMARASGDARAVAEETYNLAFAVNFLGNSGGAVELLREAEAMFRRLGDRAGEAKAVWGLAGFSEELDIAARLALSERALGIFRELGDRFHEGWVQRTAAQAAMSQGDFQLARERLADGLRIFREAGDVSAMVVFVGLFADLAAKEGDVRRAITLGGAAAAARESTATGLADWVSGSDERAALIARAETDAAAARYWAEGQAMSLDEAAAYALHDTAD